MNQSFYGLIYASRYDKGDSRHDILAYYLNRLPHRRLRNSVL